MVGPFDASQAQNERLAFLELHLYFAGELRRSDIEARFGIRPAAASRDLALYRKIAPQNLQYDLAARCYRPAETFAPIFEFKSERVLTWLLQGIGDGLDLALRPVAPCEGPGQLTRPDLKTLGVITRSMCARRAIRINYLSLSSGGTRREIVPLALADNGLRWHVRAFDRERSRFADFVLTRIELARVARKRLFKFLAGEGRSRHMVEQPMPSGRADATTGELPMGQPCRRQTLCIGIKAAVLENLSNKTPYTVPIVGVMHDAACQRPMPN